MNEAQISVFNPLERVLYRGACRLSRKPLFYRIYERTKRPCRGILGFRDFHQGKRCFIMGGGPSLKKIDRAPLAREITFGVNAIFLIFDWLGFQPTYYTVEDWLVYEDRADDIVQRVTDSICFFPIQFSRPGFDRQNHRYFRAIYEFEQHSDWPNFSTDPSRLLWIGGTVSYVCMQLAFYMGFESVYLIGFDHNYVRPDHVEAHGNEWTSQGDDPNHFHPEYFGKGYRWHDPRVDRMELAYRRAKQVFEAHGRKIFNATLGGKLEVFDRIDYDSLF